MRKKLVFIFLLSIIFGQDLNQVSLEIRDSNQASWWSKKNNNGLNPSKSYFSFSINKKFDKYDFSVSSYINKEEIILGESFINIEFLQNYNLKLGRFYRDFSSYLNDELSTGSMLISKNALPIPKIGFLGVSKLGNKNIKLDYGIAHGVLDKNNTYKSSPYLHEKFFYLKRDGKNEFGIGLVHEAVWAGSTKNNGDFPNTFKDFMKVFISGDGRQKDGQIHANALGNHLGIWDFYIIKKNQNNNLKFYYQHFFEDTSGLRFANRTDGLWGFEFTDLRYKIDYLIEYLNTSNQDRDPPYVNDSYYNHTEYSLGWSYRGNVIGNPFINNLIPNPSQVIHFGIQSFNEQVIQYKLLLSRQIDTKDSLKYSIQIGKKYDNLLIAIFLNGEVDKNLGFKLSYNL